MATTRRWIQNRALVGIGSLTILKLGRRTQIGRDRGSIWIFALATNRRESKVQLVHVRRLRIADTFLPFFLIGGLFGQLEPVLRDSAVPGQTTRARSLGDQS